MHSTGKLTVLKPYSIELLTQAANYLTSTRMCPATHRPFHLRCCIVNSTHTAIKTATNLLVYASTNNFNSQLPPWWTQFARWGWLAQQLELEPLVVRHLASSRGWIQLSGCRCKRQRQTGSSRRSREKWNGSDGGRTSARDSGQLSEKTTPRIPTGNNHL